MAQETAFAYGIEFYVGRRSRDRALSDVRAAGELVNLQAARSFKQGAAERERLHAEAVGKLRKSSEKSIEDLGKLRTKAAAQSAKAFDAMTPLKPEDALAAGKIDTSQLDAYEKKFSAQIRGMDGSLKEFASSAGDLGLEFASTDSAGVMEGFAQADAQQRKSALDDLDTRTKRRDDLIKSLKKENELAAQSLVNAKAREKTLSGPKGELAQAKAKLDLMKKTDKGYKEQNALVNRLRREQTANNKVLAMQDDILKENIRELEKQKNLKEADKQLLRELKRLHSELTGEEIRSSNIVRSNKQKEAQLDKKKREDDARAIQQLKEQNRLMQEYSRHIDDAAAQIKGTLKNAFVIGTAAVAALNYKLMAVVGTFQEFEEELINANSIWQESNDTLFAISDQVVQFGTKFGINMGQASEGLYQYASAGVEASQAMEMLNHTLKLSMAVQGDHNTLAKLTTQTIMGFNMTFDDAATVTDKFAHSINKSLIEWDDLASSIKFALPFFISTGQSIDQLLGGLEVLTNRALEAGIAGRGLRQALAEFAQHADDNASAFRKLGVEIMDNQGNMKALTDIAQEFQSVMGEGVNDMDVMIALMEDLNVRGATAFVHLVQNADDFTSAVNNLENAAGSAHEMAMIQQESLTNQIQVVKNALLAPFILSDKVGQEAGFLNVFAMEVHGIVDVVEGLFIKTMSDGSVELTKMGEIIRNFVIGALKTAKDILIIAVNVMKDFAEQGHSMVGLLNLFAVPLKIVAKLMDAFNGGFLESIVQYKLMNQLLPINSALLAKNIETMMNQKKLTDIMIPLRGKEMTMTEAKNRLTGMETTLKRDLLPVTRATITAQKVELDGAIKGAIVRERVTHTWKALGMAQMATQGVMLGMALLTQKFANDSPLWAAAIGILAGSLVGLSVAMNMTAKARDGLLIPFLGLEGWAAAAFMGAVAMGTFNVAMQQLMKPPDMSKYDVNTNTDYSTMDTGGRFMQRRAYDMGGYTQDHGLAVLQRGETVISKTQNMLGGATGSGITLNIHGDVYDSDNFAQKISEVLPTAIRRNNDIGGI
jgi:TP901 family phage tail tape measure protein